MLWCGRFNECRLRSSHPRTSLDWFFRCACGVSFCHFQMLNDHMPFYKCCLGHMSGSVGHAGSSFEGLAVMLALLSANAERRVVTRHGG